MKKVEQVVMDLSGKSNRECYDILCITLEAFAEYGAMKPQMKVLLTDVAKNIDKSEAAIRKALSRVAEDIWLYGNRSMLEKIYGKKLEMPPKPKDLIKRLAFYIEKLEDEAATETQSVIVKTNRRVIRRKTIQA